MKKHYSLLLTCHTPDTFSVDVLMTVSLTDTDEKLLTKFGSVKHALNLVVDAARHWQMDAGTSATVTELENDRVKVVEHSQAYLRSQLKNLIPLNLLDADYEYLVDLEKLDKATAAKCVEVFNKVNDYREERLAAVDEEELKLASEVVKAVAGESSDKLAILIAETCFLNMRLMPELVLENLALQFVEAEVLDALRHRAGPCLTLVKGDCTTQLSWQAAICV